jgi:prepilin-type N-terminal cleavage/methylation domain-containing protein
MNKRGFTLIEIIVSTAIFTIVVTIAIGALTSLNKASREARATRVIIDNANSAIDSMGRIIRMGIRFDGACIDADGACLCGARTEADVGNSPISDSKGAGGKNCVRFYGPVTSYSALKEIKYRYNSSNKSVERSIMGGTWQSMTAPEVEVSSMKFYVNGSRLGNAGVEGDQPVVTMVMQGVARVSRVAKPFSIQTTIAPRTPNLEIVTPE